ncbi:hypothetical protein FCR2A7T_26840 [Flavobacterium cauense R2A-7]|nr:hypothetical protein FCR2A7T_26840 [Flavobacterium cauense R2A-7]
MSVFTTFCLVLIPKKHQNKSFCPDFNIGTHIVHCNAKLNNYNNDK